MASTFLDYLAATGVAAPGRATSGRSTPNPLPWGRGGGMTDQSYAAAASKSCTLPTFKSHTDYCSQFGYTHEDDRKATEMVRQQIDQLGVMWTEFARHFDDRAPDAVTRQAFGDFYQRVDWLEAVATNLLPGITFTTYATIRATFVAARCQGAEAFRCLTRPSTATTPPISPQQRRSISG